MDVMPDSAWDLQLPCQTGFRIDMQLYPGRQVGGPLFKVLKQAYLEIRFSILQRAAGRELIWDVYGYY